MPHIENIDELTRVAPQPESMDSHPMPAKPGIMPPGRIKSLRDNTPTSEPPVRRPDSRLGFPARIRVSAALAKVVADLESRMVAILTTKVSGPEARAEAQLELALLADLRSGLATTEAPEDISVLEALGEAAERAQMALRELQGGTPMRLGQLARYVRQVLGQARALGCAPTPTKDSWQEIKRRIDAGAADDATIVTDLVGLHIELRSAIAAGHECAELSLLDAFLG